MRRPVKALVFAAAVAGLVITSVLPDTTPVIAHVPAWVTNAAHVPTYAVITALAFATLGGNADTGWSETLAVVLGLLALGAAIELIQLGTGRSASGLDVLLNGIGIGFVVVLRRRCRRHAGTSRSGSDEHDGNGERTTDSGGPAGGPCRYFR